MDADDLIAVLPKIKQEHEMNIDNEYGGASSSTSHQKSNASNTSKKVCKRFVCFCVVRSRGQEFINKKCWAMFPSNLI